MKTLSLPIVYCSADYASYPETVELSGDFTSFAKLAKKAIHTCQRDKGIASIVLHFPSNIDYKFFDDDNDEATTDCETDSAFVTVFRSGNMAIHFDDSDGFYYETEIFNISNLL